MNENEFVLAEDGWIQVTPCGMYPHKGAGVVQVIDREACEKMVADFNGRKAAENFPGVLVDFDHFSLDADKASEAAGWISELEARADGLWARVRWSDAGLAAVTGGRYRLLSPVFRYPGGTEELGEGRVRPVVLESVALTNEPNIKGGRPVANRQDGPTRTSFLPSSTDGEYTSKIKVRSDPCLPVLGNLKSGEEVANRGTEDGREVLKCGSSKVRELGKNTEDGGTGTGEGERFNAETQRRGGEGEGLSVSAFDRAARSFEGEKAKRKIEDGGEVANRWSDAARAGALAVRRIKAAQRRAAVRGSGEKDEGRRMKDEWRAGGEKDEGRRMKDEWRAEAGGTGTGEGERFNAETQRRGGEGEAVSVSAFDRAARSFEGEKAKRRAEDGGPRMPRILSKWALQGAGGEKEEGRRMKDERRAEDGGARVAVGHDKALARSAAEAVRLEKARRRGKG